MQLSKHLSLFAWLSRVLRLPMDRSPIGRRSTLFLHVAPIRKRGDEEVSPPPRALLPRCRDARCGPAPVCLHPCGGLCIVKVRSALSIMHLTESSSSLWKGAAV